MLAWGGAGQEQAGLLRPLVMMLKSEFDAPSVSLAAKHMLSMAKLVPWLGYAAAMLSSVSLLFGSDCGGGSNSFPQKF